MAALRRSRVAMSADEPRAEQRDARRTDADDEHERRCRSEPSSASGLERDGTGRAGPTR